MAVPDITPDELLALSYDKMTARQVAYLADIRELAHDDNEAAHQRQDKLWLETLVVIGVGRFGKERARALAVRAANAQAIDFERWYG